MKSKITSTVLASLGLLGGTAYGQFTFVNATSGVSGNTTLANGGLFAPPLNGTTGADSLWEERTTFGSGGNIFESGGENVTENAGELRTTISGLVAGGTYEIYVNFWDPTSPTEDWNIRAGATSNPGGNTLFAAADAATDLPGSTGAVLASTLTYSTAPTLFTQDGRALLAGFVGTLIANGSGQISVFIDDLPTSNNVNRRTWYEGVSYAAVAPIPEPGSFALIAGALSVGLCVVRRRRRA